MNSEASNHLSTMKSEQHAVTDRTLTGRHGERGRVRDKDEERKEALVLLAIAILFLANVLLYICHHYGLTTQADARPQAALAARVITD
jgi:hypothetical protein